jgi:hypothetical protein
VNVLVLPVPVMLEKEVADKLKALTFAPESATVNAGVA